MVFTKKKCPKSTAFAKVCSSHVDFEQTYFLAFFSFFSFSFLFSFFSCSFFSFSAFFSFFFSSLISLYFHLGGSRKPFSIFFFFCFFGVASDGLLMLILGMQPEGNTLFRRAILRGMNVVATLVEAKESMLPRRSPSAQHIAATDSADGAEGSVCKTVLSLWHTELSSSSFSECFFTSSGTASRRLPTSGGLEGHSGRHPVEMRGL